MRPVDAAELSLQVEWQTQVYVESRNLEEGVVYVRPPGSAGVQAVPFRAVPARALVHVAARWQAGPIGLFGTVENLFGTRATATIVVNSADGRFYEPGPGTVLTLGASVAAWPQGARMR